MAPYSLGIKGFLGGIPLNTKGHQYTQGPKRAADQPKFDLGRSRLIASVPGECFRQRWLRFWSPRGLIGLRGREKLIGLLDYGVTPERKPDLRMRRESCADLRHSSGHAPSGYCRAPAHRPSSTGTVPSDPRWPGGFRPSHRRESACRRHIGFAPALRRGRKGS